MTETSKIDLEHPVSKYKLVVPDGGWGYVIMFAVVLVFGVTIIPMSGFGIVYSQFLREVGDVTSGAAITNSIFNTALCFTGLAANQLLQKISFRKVGVIGVCLYFIGSLSILFVNSLFQLVMTFGILQGIGFGLIMPTTFSAFNIYFDKRRDVIMAMSQVLLGILGIFVPSVYQYLMNKYGFRGTIAITCAMSLNLLPAMLTLQPVKWHLKKRRLSLLKVKKDHDNTAIVPLLKPNEEQNNGLVTNNLHKLSLENGNAAKSVQNIAEEKQPISYWKMLAKSLDLELFKDPVYINIICGIALSITSDLAFLPLYPTVLVGYGFNPSEVTIIMTTYFIADLTARTCLFVLYALFPVRNRYVFLIRALFSGIFRIVFTMNNSFWWITCVSAILGFLRSPIQSILPLVVAEAYGDRFVTAFSLYMVICGCIALGVGFIAAAIKNSTNNDIMVVHLYSLAYLLCGIPWTIELIYLRLFKRKT